MPCIKKWDKESIKIRAISIAYAIMSYAALVFYSLATLLPLVWFGIGAWSVTYAAFSAVPLAWLSIEWRKYPYKQYSHDSKFDVPHCGNPINPNLESDKQKHARGERQLHDIVQITSIWGLAILLLTLCFASTFFLNLFPK